MSEDPIKVFGGLTMRMVPKDVQICRQLRDGFEWEPDTSKIIREALKPGDTFIDCGANIGWFSILASRTVGPDGRVIAFEPWKPNYDVLKENLRLNCCENVETYNFPLWSSRKKLYVWPNDEANCGDVRTRLASDAEIKEGLNVVDSHSLDYLISSDTVRFVKIDCQESDFEVIKGGERLFTESEKIGLIVEMPNTPDPMFGLHRVRPTEDGNNYYEK